MIKTFLSRIVLAAVFSCVLVVPALAQNADATTRISPGTTAPVKGIGPAPANSKQNHILKGALSPETRQTLQKAMNSSSTADTTHPAPSAK
jgi:hypothetical protein